MKYNILKEIAGENGCDVFENEAMSRHTSFKIGGDADVFLKISNKISLLNVLKYINKERLPYYLIGNGCNLLVCDEGFRGVIIKLAGGEFSNISLKDDVITCGSGVKLSAVCLFAAKNSLSGIEFMWGIPASVGGAVFMNAGAFGGEIKDILVSCEHVDKNLKEIKLSKDGLKNFGYRTSFYTNTENIIIKAFFKLKKSNYTEIKAKMNDFLHRRKAKQPLNYPNAGSIFKRPEGYFVGALLDECGLRGRRVGGAQISLKHSGFIVNTGKATCNDVLNLIKLIQYEVFLKKSVVLELEIKTLNNS
ncbi:MAG: UDP-N-acetylmuramate dehydrogenase [Oscillospiraceae bacterium]|jgi:UDP-N-acetylmuramate dehydrogenase|nr:UDP-N-acetylmuramate dehydrogenase [Oscillospiraceae bacterium]